MEAFKLDKPSPENIVSKIHSDTYDYIDPAKIDLSGKYILITGASKGIGKAIAISYAKAGASGIAILARSDLSKVVAEVEDAATKVNRSKPKVLALKADTTNAEEVFFAAGQFEHEFGCLDVLINNAGYLEARMKIAESDPDEWWKTWEVNIKGTYLMCRALLPLLLKGGEKTIVNISSTAAIVVAPGASAYQSTKQGLIRFTEFLTAEYADQGLLAFSVHPGGVMTDLGKKLPDFLHEVLRDTPELGADTIVWLTSEKREWLASRFISVHWDMEEFLTKRSEIENNNLLRLRMRYG